jgi:hypothetical protein
MIMNAITKEGWVKNGKVFFKSHRDTYDYHGQMNWGIFVNWFDFKVACLNTGQFYYSYG